MGTIAVRVVSNAFNGTQPTGRSFGGSRPNPLV